jgi:hypothetical protein
VERIWEWWDLEFSMAYVEGFFGDGIKGFFNGLSPHIQPIVFFNLNNEI